MKRFVPFICIALLLSLTACLNPAPQPKPEEPSIDTAVPEVSSTVEELQPELQIPNELVQYLTAAGSSQQALDATGCSQLVTVIAQGNTATIRFYEKINNAWQEDGSLLCSGHVGQNGVSFQKAEGDRSTPIGLYAIGSAFYHSGSAPATGLPVFEIQQDSYWVDDPNSAYYNQYATANTPKDWNSAEHMISESGYRYGFVVDYNTQQVKGAGSAIFFHIGNGYTLGCISTAESNVLSYLAKLNQQNTPHILIAPQV
ncbi:MAG: L,D-transpeptidase family protein, partial [Clostridia bacterium]|nr:L,D-transpeptidase family protein [Clostridia bacterium]